MIILRSRRLISSLQAPPSWRGAFGRQVRYRPIPQEARRVEVYYTPNMHLESLVCREVGHRVLVIPEEHHRGVFGTQQKSDHCNTLK